MARTPSSMVDLGTPGPSFALPDPAGRVWRFDEFAAAPALLVAFWCNHCPYVQHIRDRFAALAAELAPRGLQVVAINSNDFDAYPDDRPEAMAAEARRGRYVFPYLVDADQSVARAYRAACTPDFFAYGADRRLAYRGQFDPSRPFNDVPVTGSDLRHAVDAILAGRAVAAPQLPSLGCNIKWKPQP